MEKFYKDTDEEDPKKIEIINYSLNQEQKTLKFLENNSKNFVFQFCKVLPVQEKQLFISSE